MPHVFLCEMQPFPYVLALLNSFMNFGGDLIVVLAQKREGSVQGLYFCGLIGGITEVLNRKWKFNSVSIRKFENFHVKEASTLFCHFSFKICISCSLVLKWFELNIRHGQIANRFEWLFSNTFRGGRHSGFSVGLGQNTVIRKASHHVRVTISVSFV